MKSLGVLFIALPIIAFARSPLSGLDQDSIPVWGDSVSHKDSSVVETQETPDSLRLETRGSKTIQVVVGDGGTQVDQELRLSVQGEVAPSIFVDALLSDVGREAGDQQTATLEEVDQIYFRVESPHFFLHLGDLTWIQNTLGLSGLNRSSLGAGAGVRAGHTEVRAVVGYDELEHISTVFSGVDGQRSGYLIGTGTDFYLAVVPQSETVWMNGVKLSREKDYVVNYAGGVLDFKGLIIPGSSDEIRVEYDGYNSGGVQAMKAADGNYRSKNIWLDVAGFRLESDVDRLKRGTWSDDDLSMLKADTGGVFDRADSLGTLERPWRLDRMGARMRLQGHERWFADGEMVYGKMDTNTVSDKVNGPHGMAFRWHFSSDSTSMQKHGIWKVENSGDYIEQGYNTGSYQGTDRNWDSYTLSNDWDLDSVGLGGGLRYDDFLTCFRLPNAFFTGVEWGYRQSIEDSLWNSSRARLFLDHRGKVATSSISLVRVASVQELEVERYQGLVNAIFNSGFVRPFGSGSYGMWYKDSLDTKLQSEQMKAAGGFEMGPEEWTLRESLLGQRARRGYSNESLEDSLQLSEWDQSANYNGKNFTLTHLLQYKRTWLDTSGNTDSWIAEQTIEWGHSNETFSGRASYDLGLTSEQPYIAIYKAVAPGTGDVLYDSLTGLFVEGVDKGDYVYEGMGRDDSADVVCASSAKMTLNFNLNPGLLFGVNQGFVRDISLTFDGSSEGRDTTGGRLYLPPLWRPTLRNLSSGIFTVEGALKWNHPSGDGSIEYKVGTESEKKNTSLGYFQNRLWHGLEGIYSGRKKETWTSELGLEYVDLVSYQKMNWEIREGRLSWRRELFWNLSVEPAGWIRQGNGKDESSPLDAFLKQGSLELSWDNQKGATVVNTFSMTHVSSDSEVLPYQMVSGFGKGTTYRGESVVSVEANDFLTLSLRYIVRFGDAEEGVFQKFSTEAKAFF